MRTHHLLLSYHQADAETAARLSRALAQRGLAVEPIGADSLPALNEAGALALCLGAHGLDESQKEVLGAALFRQRQTAAGLFPVIPVLLPQADPAPAFCLPHAWVDLRDPAGWAGAALDGLVAAAQAGRAPLRPPAAIIEWRPFRGLRPFREEDAAFFYGREALAQRLLAEVSAQPVTLLLGPPGSGKTSLIQAGLLPHLRLANYELPSHPKWLIRTFTPGDRPFERLAAALAGDEPPAARRLSYNLSSGEVSLAQAVEAVLSRHAHKRRVLLVVDQWEELFTQADPAQRQRFSETLLAGLPHPNLSLLLALPADFYGQAMSLHPALSRALERHALHVEPLSPAEMQTVMVKSARPVTLAFEPGLVERITADLTGQPQPLPLLQLTLAELWRQHRGGLLSQAGYDKIGGVAGVINFRAEELFQNLTPPEQSLARRLLTRLAPANPGEPLSARPLALTELEGGLQPERLTQAGRVVQTFAAVDLLRLKTDPGGGGERVYAPHAWAVPYWPRWQSWLHEEQEFRLWRQRLAGPLARWERDQADEAGLLQAEALSEAESWLRRRRNNLDAEGRVFIWRSLARRDWQRDQRWLVGLALLVLLLLGAGIVVVQQTLLVQRLRQERREAIEAEKQAETLHQAAAEKQAQAERQQETTLAQLLALQSVAGLDDQLERSVLLAIESLRRAPSPESQRALFRGLLRLPRPLAVLKSGLSISTLRFSPDGQFLATAGPAGIPGLWETASGRPLTGFAESDHGFPISASVQLSNAAARLLSEVEAHPVSALAFSPEGEWLAAGRQEGQVQIWAVATGRSVAEFNQGEAVTALAFGPAAGSPTPGQLLAVGSRSGSLKIWQMTAELALAQTSGAVFPFQLKPKLEQEISILAHQGAILGLSFSPDGRRLVTASADSTAGLWNVAAMFNPKLKFAPSPVEQPLWELARLGHGGPVGAVAFSPECAGPATGCGARLATGSADHTVRLWDVSANLKTGRELARLPQPGLVTKLLFSPNGRWLAAASDDHTVRVWPAVTAAQAPQTELSLPAPINDLAFSPDSRWLAAAGADGTARVWAMATGQEIARMAHPDEVTAVAFSPDPDRPWLATAGPDGLTRLWQVETAHFNQAEAILGLDFDSPEGRLLAAQSRDEVGIWDIESGRLVSRVSQAGGIDGAAFSPDGRWLATAGRDKTARLWEVSSGAQVAQLTHPKPVQIVAFDPGGSRLATVSRDDIVRLWNMAVLTKTTPLTAPRTLGIAHTGTVNAIDFSPDGQLLASASTDGVVWVSNVRSARPLLRLAHPEAVLDVAFSPPFSGSTSSQWLATAGADQTVRLWEVATGQEMARLQHPGPVEEVLFSPDGRYLATRAGRLVQVWDMAGVLSPMMVERPAARLDHAALVRAMAFSPPGAAGAAGRQLWLATVSGGPAEPGTMQVWQAVTGQKLLELTPDHKIEAVLFSPDGRLIWTGSADGQIRSWWWQPGDLIEQACTRLTRNLTRAEWQQYLGDREYQPTCPNVPAGG